MSYNRKHEITVNELTKFKQNESILFASASLSSSFEKKNKRLYIGLNGVYTVTHNNETVVRTFDANEAIEKYNDI